MPGNAFAVRMPVVPPAPPPPPPPPKVALVVPTPPPPAPAPVPPPIQVIGTWDDGVAPGVFVSTPNGTQLARKGTVLLAEYVVTALTPQQMTVQHSVTKRELQLSIPRVAGK